MEICLPIIKAKLFRGLKVSQSKTKNIESVGLAIYRPKFKLGSLLFLNSN